MRDGKLAAHSCDKPPVLLGFDDGFKNVIRNALPVLEEFKVPALFFVIGEVLQNPSFVPWYVERRYLIRKAAERKPVQDNAMIDLCQPRDRANLQHRVDASFRACRSEDDRQRLLTDFANFLGVSRPTGPDLDDDLKFVDREDLSSLAPSSFLTVASHAMTHRDLETLTYDDQVHELGQSDRLLRDCSSYYPVIAYPNGSFNKDTISIARGIYRGGFAVLRGSSYGNVFAYPRIGIGRDSVQELSYAISAKRRTYVLPLKRFLSCCRRMTAAKFYSQSRTYRYTKTVRAGPKR